MFVHFDMYIYIYIHAYTSIPVYQYIPFHGGGHGPGLDGTCAVVDFADGRCGVTELGVTKLGDMDITMARTMEQCSKPLLVDVYRGLYYPIYGYILGILIIQ